jgi:hypothetical protein
VFFIADSANTTVRKATWCRPTTLICSRTGP